ncbi:MAG: metallophosphoesterase [Christensenellaceae bacterium]
MLKLPKLRYYTKESDHLTRRWRIALLSDLHGTPYKEELAFLIQGEKPDLIAFVGDAADRGQVEAAETLLRFLRVPVFYVFGNHEYSGKICSEMADLAFRYNVTLLRGNSVSFGELVLSGLDDPAFGRKKWNETFEALSDGAKREERFKILLTHRPDDHEAYRNSPFDLVLCGHTHGGQIRFPGVNGVYAPGQGLFPRYAGGEYDLDGVTMIVGRGLVQNRLPRWGNPAELPVIDLLPKKE